MNATEYRSPGIEAQINWVPPTDQLAGTQPPRVLGSLPGDMGKLDFSNSETIPLETMVPHVLHDSCRDLTLEEMAQFGLPQLVQNFSPGPNELRIRPEAYVKGAFYPMHVGDVIQDRYLVLQKLGYGVTATVWLVRDVHKGRYFALKVLSSECYGAAIDIIEVEALERFKADNSNHSGRKFVSDLVHHFSLPSPVGRGFHVCLVFELMAETIQTFAAKYGGSIPPWLMKRFTKQMLLALDYAHKTGVVHTDIKADNIMVQLPNESIVDERYMGSDEPTDQSSCDDESELKFLHWPNSNHDLIRSGYGIDYKTMLDIKTWQYPTKPMKDVYLGSQPKMEEILELNIAVCDWGCASWDDQDTNEEITPDIYRSPECLIEAPWDCKTDIWTLGCLLIDLLTDHDAFAATDCQGQYNKTQHLHEITSNFGPFPESLLKLGARAITIPNFDWEGNVSFPPSPASCLPPLMQCFAELDFEHDQDEYEFCQMLSKMMCVDPEKRSSAEDLLKEPWLRDDQSDDHASSLPPNGDTIDQLSHPDVSPTTSIVPHQSDPPVPSQTSPVISVKGLSTEIGLCDTPTCSLEWETMPLALDLGTTTIISPHKTSRQSQAIGKEQHSLCDVSDRVASHAFAFTAGELATVSKHQQKMLREEKQKVRTLEADLKAVMDRQLQMEQSQHAEVQSLKQQNKLLQAETARESQKVAQLQTELDKLIIKTLTVKDGSEGEEKMKKVEQVEDIGTPAPKLSKYEAAIPSVKPANPTIQKARVTNIPSDIEAGPVLLGTALVVACPKEVLLLAGLATAAYGLWSTIRAI
ncbi:hypothetical protein FKW77_006137 [Venturia effusa]|uniref:Protein kinase domain-containing protein n=1 Tax=Venturia effusa TaxID=50376 RepID=A0A517LDV1_9PEZI|nr:hypothetical protein FKW77_006137 [Venturia effusa]